jgi:nicotinamide phosphoribosyltransferase
MKNNIITMTDSYKQTHWKQYPEGTEKVYSYFEARKGATYNRTVFFGLQYLLKEYLEGVVVTMDDVMVANSLCEKHIGPDIFNMEGWVHIVKEHGGKLPVRIKAVPEGTPVSVDNVLMTVENTDPKCFFLTNHLETLLTHVWASSTVATLSRECKSMMTHYLTQTSDNPDAINFMLHDFGFRGVSSVESAGVSGAGHLINFMGTDTIRAMEVAEQYYGAIQPVAFAVPATEHSVMTSYGESNERELIGDLIATYPTGILSLVIDSYDYAEFIRKAGAFKEQILARDGKVVFRPDSGEPVSTTLDVLEIVAANFGYTQNKKGFKVLNPKVGVLWGDGIDYQGIRDILHAMQMNGWSADNLVFGMGGGLLQKVNRDVQRFAFKCSAQLRNGKWHDIQKKPRDVSKASKKGRLALQMINGKFHTESIPATATDDVRVVGDMLETVFENGVVTKEYTFDEVRANAKL